MFDIGWSELLVIGSLALIVVGPKDLPKLLRTLGQYTNHARSMARDFQRSMEQAAREADISDMKELRDTADSLRKLKTMSLDDALLHDATRNPAAPVNTPPANPLSTGGMRVDEGVAAATPRPAAPAPAPVADEPKRVG